MERTIEVQTYYVGKEPDAIEIANEWNELLNTNEFKARTTRNPNEYLIMGLVTKDDLKKFPVIKNEFMINK
jgi:hypothetical protein